MRLNSTEQCFLILNPGFDHRYTINFVRSVVNAIFSPLAVIAGHVAVLSIINPTPWLRDPSNLFLACLAVSDMLVGVIVQPSYVAFRLPENHEGFVP